MIDLKNFIGTYVQSNKPASDRPRRIYLRGLGIISIRARTPEEQKLEKDLYIGTDACPGYFAEFVEAPSYDAHLQKISIALNKRLKRLPTALCLLGVMAGTAALTAGIIFAAPVAIGLGAAAIVIGTIFMFQNRRYQPELQYRKSEECWAEAEQV